MEIIKIVLGWIYRHFISFILIVAVLVAGAVLGPKTKRAYAEYQSVPDLEQEHKELSDADAQLQKLISHQTQLVTERVNRLKLAAATELNTRIKAIEGEVAVLQNNRCTSMDLIVKPKDCLVGNAKVAIEIAVLQQERHYLEQLLSIKVSKESCDSDLKALEKVLQAAPTQMLEKLRNLEILNGKCRYKVSIPLTWCHEEKARQLAAIDSLTEKIKTTINDYNRRKKICDGFHVLDFNITKGEIEQARNPVLDRLIYLKKNIDAYQSGFFFWLIEQVIQVMPTALKILASIVLAPLAIKGFLYFLIAPLASGRTANCLIPESSGALDEISDLNAAGLNHVSLSAEAKEIPVDCTEEFLVHHDYLLALPAGGHKDTKWLLDYKLPFSSIASGLFALTRIRLEHKASCIVAAKKSPVAKLAVITIPSGSAFVLQPKCLVGIVQKRNQTVTITRHWRLGSLHAWLTLQLRYLVFHGPVKLIVEGNGVSIGKAGGGLSINQTSTMGFSANLPYATTRSEPFLPYLTGTQELFDDYFPSGSGYFLYEVKPLDGKRSNIVFGRGIEGFLDSILKLFGL